MNVRLLTILAGIAGVAVLTLGALAAESSATDDQGVFDQAAQVRAPDDATAQAGVEPQARGPVHEAFAAPTADRPQPGPVVPKQPPEAVEEVPPAEKPAGDDVQWLAGYWSWDEERGDFVWVSGIWRAIPPGMQWVPGHWVQVDGGWQWAPGLWAAAEGGDLQVVPKPPAPVAETPPAQPAPATPAPATAAPATPAAGTAAPEPATTQSDSTFVPGNYVYQNNQFVWQPGFYVVNRPGFVWVPARYVWTPCGYVFVPGFWDYDLEHRGLLFAPVLIDPQLLAQADWVYTPSVIVHDLALLDALFIRADGDYYFGDYFDPGYARLGYVSWFAFRHHRFGLDPLYSHYRWLHRGDPTWERRVRTLYTLRSRSLLPRPPHNLTQQKELGRQLLAGKAGRGALERSVLLGSVNRVNHNLLKMETLDRAGRRRFQNIARQQRVLGRQRELAENKLLGQGQSAFRRNGTGQTLALNLPKSATAVKPGAGRTPPPPTPFRRNERLTTNTTRTRVNGNTPTGTKLNTNVVNRRNNRVDSATNLLNGGRINATATNPLGTPGGNRPSGGTTPVKPSGNRLVPERVNGGRLPSGGLTNDPPARFERTERLNANLGRVNPSPVANTIRQTPVLNTTTQRLPVPTFNRTQTFSNFSRPQPSFSRPAPRPSGGGGRRRDAEK